MTNANNHYSHYNGTECYYKHTFSAYVYTDGLKALAMDCGAYWLIDLVISHQLVSKVRAELFQVWQLQKEKENIFKVVATDGSYNVIATQPIPYSDFPYDGCTVYLVEGVLMLPCKY
jgi:hypothetical protein